MTTAITIIDFKLQLRPVVPAYGPFLTGAFPPAALILAGAFWPLQLQLLLTSRPPKSTAQHGLTFCLTNILEANVFVERLAYESSNEPLYRLGLRHAPQAPPMIPPSRPTFNDDTTCTLRLLAALSLDSVLLAPTAKARPGCYTPQPTRASSHQSSRLRLDPGPRQAAVTVGTGPIKEQTGPSQNQFPVLSLDSKNDELRAAFACFIGKYEIDNTDCQGRHYKDVRTLCRSTHLDQHRDNDELGHDQREKIRQDTKGLKKHQREVERWRDIFVELYPDLAGRRAQLNPYFGEPLLPGGEDPRTASESLLRQEVDSTIAHVRRPSRPLFDVPAPGNDAGVTAAPQSHAGFFAPRCGDQPLQGARTRPRNVVSLPQDMGQRSTGSGPRSTTRNRPLLPAGPRTPSHSHAHHLSRTPGGTQVSELSISEYNPSTSDDPIVHSSPSTYADTDGIFSLPQTPQRKRAQTSATTPSWYTGDAALSRTESQRTPAPVFSLEPHRNVVPSILPEMASYPDRPELDPEELYSQDEGRAGGPPLLQSPVNQHPASESPAAPPYQYVNPEWMTLRSGTEDASLNRKRAREHTP